MLCSKVSFLRCVNQHKHPLGEVVTARCGHLGWVRCLWELGDSSLPGLKGRTIWGQRTVDGAFPSGVALVGGKPAEPAPNVVPRCSSQWPSLSWSPECPSYSPSFTCLRLWLRATHSVFMLWGLLLCVCVREGDGMWWGDHLSVVKADAFNFLFLSSSYFLFFFYFSLPLQSQITITNNLIVASVVLLQQLQSFLGTWEVMYV